MIRAYAPALSAPGYAAEIRFGVVMYGGVSLAIYINGVTNELFEMACATPRAGFDLVRNKDQPESCTRDIYRRLSWLVGNADLRATYAEAIRNRLTDDPWPAELRDGVAQSPTALAPTRLVVDVIAGTSAGGINGIFLAKALANGQQFSKLQEMWIAEGDLERLLNDRASYNTKPAMVDRSAAPTSLLNSDRMFFKLREAMDAMPPLVWKQTAPPASPLADQIDLFVTTTDIQGSVVPLRLFDKVVYELRFKQSYHFSYPYGATGGNDFSSPHTPFLAFAARCTSSFPFAFEPMTLDAVTRLVPAVGTLGLQQWNPFFPNLPHQEVQAGQHLWRAFGDGGYLDNKPFSYVVAALSQRFSSVPLERKLLYVEPSPERRQVAPDDAPCDKKAPFGTPPEATGAPPPPHALSNALAALSTIPRYETIREDLQAVLQRNRRIERIERLVRLGERDLDLAPAAFDPLKRVLAQGPWPDWQRLKLSEIVQHYGLAYVPHFRLRLNAVTDDLAERLGRLWSIDGNADAQYALRVLVRLWRERCFNDEGGEGDDGLVRDTNSSFLDQFDVEYRMRRLAYLMRKTDQLLRLMRKCCAHTVPAGVVAGHAVPPLSEVERQLMAQMSALFAPSGGALDPATVVAALAALQTLKAQMATLREQLLRQRQVDALRVAADAAVVRADMRPTLVAVLKLLLGQESLTKHDRCALGQYADALIAKMQQPGAQGVASISRTLQESVLLRGRLFFDQYAPAPAAVDGVAGPRRGALLATPLQQALEHDVLQLRYKRAGPGTAAAALPLEAIGAQLAALLGDPEGAAAVLPAAAPVPPTDAGLALRLYLSRMYRRFDLFDQMSFGLYYDTGTGEPSTVEVVRVSPADATSLVDEAAPNGRPKLAGTALGNFGAFLDRSWRVNDIMWGRLDGAERLIEALLPMADPDSVTIRGELIRRAHDGILAETLVPQGTAELTGVLVEALRKLAPGQPASEDKEQQKRHDQALRQLITSLSEKADDQGRIGILLSALFDAPQLRQYVTDHRLVKREPDPKTTLQSAARAVSITGRVLQRISSRRHASTAASRWLARMGLLLQGLVAVSLPGALRQRWFSHGLKVLYCFELVALVAALVFGSGDMRTLALTAFGATAGLHLLCLVTGDALRQENRWLRRSVMLFIAVGVSLAAVGGLLLYYQQAQQAMCWSHPLQQIDPRNWAMRLCGGLTDLRHWFAARGW